MFVLKLIFILNFKGEQAVVVGAGLGRIQRTLNDSLSSKIKISLKFIFILNFKGGPEILGGDFFYPWFPGVKKNSPPRICWFSGVIFFTPGNQG